MEIVERRPLSSDALDVMADATTQERFQGPQDDHSGHDHPPGQHPGEASQPDYGSMFAYDAPESWVELPSSPQRWVNLQPQGDERASVYFTIMPGEAGGLAANVDRWRSQVGLPPATAAELQSLPTKLVFGTPATFVDVSGHFTGMGDADLPDARLVGLIQTTAMQAPDGSLEPYTVFVKFTGPADLVAAELEHFDLFCASLRGAAEDSRHQGPHYTLPPGWSDPGPSGMRMVNLEVEGAELSVIQLEGDGGGLADNVNRWRNQLGLDPIDPAQAQAMERVPVLGTSGYLFDETGPYQGMVGGAVPDARMIGALVIGPGQSYFIKFVGPAEVVTREAGAFRAFLDSLELDA